MVSVTRSAAVEHNSRSFETELREGLGGFMNRSTLLLSALLLSGTMAEPALAAHASRPAVAASSASRGATSVHNKPTPDAKCGRCSGTGGRSSASRTTKDVHTADSARGTFAKDGHDHHGPDGARESRRERHHPPPHRA